MIYVLILWYTGWGQYTSELVVQTFKSKAACEQVMKYIKDNKSFVSKESKCLEVKE